MNKLITQSPARYEEVKSYMSRFILSVTRDKKLHDPLAFVLVRDSLIGESYKLFVNCENPILEQFLYMHECGHIIFDHIENDEMKAASVSSRIRARYQEHSDRFPNADKFFEFFKKMMFNIVMDLEVNSKLFTEEEFEAFEKLASEVLGKKTKFYYPTRFNFPVGKTWKEYLTYALDNLGEFIDNKIDQMNDDDENENEESGENNNNNEQQSSSQSDEDGECGDSEPSSNDEDSDGCESDSLSDGDESDNSTGSSSNNNDNNTEENGEPSESENGQSSQTSDDEADSEGDDNEELSATDKELRSRNGNKIRNSKLTDEEEQKIMDEVNQTLKPNLERKASKFNSESVGRGGHKSATHKDVEKMSFDSIKKEILKRVFDVKNFQNRRDVMYNANRRKLGGSTVLVPKDIVRTEFRADDFVVILDVSGSVSSKLIDKTTSVFGDLSNQFGKKSRIVFWDDELVEDVLLKDVKGICAGGGTDIAGAIDYAAKKGYIKNNTKLFIISDFCDYLWKWDASLKNLKTKNVYGICWEESADLNVVEHDFKHIYYLDSSEM